MNRIYFQKLCPDAVIPSRATRQSAGFDLSLCGSEPVTVQPGETVMIHTGVAVVLPEGTAGMVYPRSGLASKFGVTLSNCVGVIDSDYRGELKVAVSNLGAEEYAIAPGERIAQLVILPVCMLPVEEASALDETRRGAGGFGSTGKE